MDLHTLHLIIVFALVIGTFVAFVREWLSPDMVALSAFAILLLTGTIRSDDALRVFSNSAPITIGAMFVLSAALERTGVIDALARMFLRFAGTSELRALFALGVVTVPLSAFINNTPVVVVFMPVVLALARTTELKASRLLIPLSSIAVALIDFAVVLVLLVVLFAWWQFVPDWRVLCLPFFVTLTLVTALGTGLWLTALTVKYRDFRFVVPFLLQVGLFLSPVGFSSTNLPTWRTLYSLNPMVGAIDGFRWCLLRGQPAIDPTNLAISVVTSLLLLVSGLWYFRRTERTFADII